MLLIHLEQSAHSKSALFWVHTDVVKQVNSVYVYLLISVTVYIDFNTTIKKLPLSGDGWTLMVHSDQTWREYSPCVNGVSQWIAEVMRLLVCPVGPWEKLFLIPLELYLFCAELVMLRMVMNVAQGDVVHWVVYKKLDGIYFIYNKLRLSWIGKLSFKLTCVICVMHDTIQMVSKYYLSLPIDYCTISFPK